jgi:hypothetical protein
MSEPTAPVAAPVAAAPVSQPQPAPSTPTPPTPPKFDSKQAADSLFKLLTSEAGAPAAAPEPEKKPAPAAPEAPKPEPEKKETAPAAAAPEKPIKVRGKKPATPTEETRPPIPKKADAPAPAPTAAPAAAPAKPAPADDAKFEESLDDEERALLTTAKDAEKYLGEKYKGHGTKMLGFLKEAAAKAADVEAGKLDESELKEWYSKHLPKVGALDRQTIIEARAVERAKQELEPKLAEERHARWVDAEQPKVRKKGDDVYRKLITTALPDEVQAAIKERTKGITDHAKYVEAVKAVEADYALETEITQNIVTAATEDMEEFHRLTTTNPATKRALTEFDAKNPQHARILQIMTDVCNEFKTSGGAELKRGGKWFATREEFAGMEDAVKRGELQASTLNDWWTFTNEEVVERALANVKPAVTRAVDAQRKLFEEKYHFKRTLASATAAPAAAAPQPSPTGAPPAPRPAPAPAPGGVAAPSLGARMDALLNSKAEG